MTATRVRRVQFSSMLIDEKFTVKAPLQKVWDFLLDPEKIGSCVPGCEKIEITEKNTYLSIVKVKVGPISAKFKFTTTLTDIQPPRHVKAVGGGADIDKKGIFNQESTLDLKEVSPGEIEVSYRSEVKVGGMLATFGDLIMRAKSKELGEKFAQSVKQKVEGKE